MLIGPKYLSTGQNIDYFLRSKFLDRIIRCLKQAAKIYKNKPEKRRTARKSKGIYTDRNKKA